MFHLVSFFVRFMRGSRPNIHTRPTPHQNQGCDCCEWEVFHFPSAFNSSPVKLVRLAKLKTERNSLFGQGAGTGRQAGVSGVC